MKNTKKKGLGLSIILTLILAAFLIPYGCGGSGGGDDDVAQDNLDPTLPESTDYRYNIGAYWVKRAVENLQVRIGDMDPVTMSAQLEGTYNLETGIITAEAKDNRYVNIIGNSLWAGAGYEGVELVNECGIMVREDVHMPGRGNPTQGALQADLRRQFEAREALGFDGIRMEFTVEGVTLTALSDGEPVDGMASEYLAWADLEKVEEAVAPPALQYFGWAACSAWRFYYDQVLNACDFLVLLSGNDDELAASTTIELAGAEFAGNKGSLSITWSDASGDGTLGWQDDFSCTFTDWWVDDPDNDVDTMLNGRAGLMHYLEDEDFLGFDLVFEDFLQQETTGGNIEEGGIRLDGGFCLTVYL